LIFFLNFSIFYLTVFNTEFSGVNFSKPHLINNSQQGNFFTTNLNQVHNWIKTLDYQAQNKSDNIYEDGLFPIILKFNLNRNSFEKDQHSEYPDSYFSRRIVQPQSIFCWSGVNWIPIEQWSRLKTSYFVSYNDDYSGEEYWELVEPYPMPR